MCPGFSQILITWIRHLINDMSLSLILGQRLPKLDIPFGKNYEEELKDSGWRWRTLILVSFQEASQVYHRFCTMQCSQSFVRWLLLTSFCRFKDWHSERLNHLLISQSNKVLTQTRVVQLQRVSTMLHSLPDKRPSLEVKKKKNGVFLLFKKHNWYLSSGHDVTEDFMKTGLLCSFYFLNDKCHDCVPQKKK